MPTLIPPQPIGALPGSQSWNDWIEKLRTAFNNGQLSVTWANIDFTGSSITDLVNRAHNNLQSIQGGSSGERYHLNAAQASAVSSFVTNGIPVVTNSGNPGTSDIPSGYGRLWKNTTSNEVRLWVNDGGVMKSVILS